MLIGGLIREQREGGNAGLPWLKDIPLAGALFRSSANNKTTRTELVLLITPHVMEDDFESRAITEAFRGQFNWSADIPFAAKERAQTDDVPRPEAAPIAAERSVVSEPYVVPKAVVEQSLPATPRLRAPEPVPAPSTAPPAPSSSPSPAVKSAPAAAAAKPQPLTDEKVRQELLNFLRQQ
jgi:general secretion pathway protein D